MCHIKKWDMSDNLKYNINTRYSNLSYKNTRFIRNNMGCLSSKLKNDTISTISYQILYHIRYYITPDIISHQILYHTRYYIISDIISHQILYHTRYYITPDIISYRILYHNGYYIIPDIISYRILYHTG